MNQPHIEAAANPLDVLKFLREESKVVLEMQETVRKTRKHLTAMQTGQEINDAEDSFNAGLQGGEDKEREVRDNKVWRRGVVRQRDEEVLRIMFFRLAVVEASGFSSVEAAISD